MWVLSGMWHHCLQPTWALCQESDLLPWMTDAQNLTQTRNISESQAWNTQRNTHRNIQIGRLTHTHTFRDPCCYIHTRRPNESFIYTDTQINWGMLINTQKNSDSYADTHMQIATHKYRDPNGRHSDASIPSVTASICTMLSCLNVTKHIGH